jgi:hypothetical protein
MDDTRGEISHVDIIEPTNESTFGPSILEPTNELSFGAQSKEWSVERSKMDDPRGEISHVEIFVPTNEWSFGPSTFDLTNESSFSFQSKEWSIPSTKESKEPMNEALKNIQTKELSFGNQSKEWNVESTKESKEPMNEALKNIHNLIDIYDSEISKVALADWESSEQAYRKRVHRKKKVLRNTRIEVITLTGFFFALQGLLLTAAAVSSYSQCTNLGFLLAVSGLVTFCALAFVCHKELTMRRLQSAIVLEKAVQKVLFDILCGSNAKEPLREILCTADFLIAALL